MKKIFFAVCASLLFVGAGCVSTSPTRQTSVQTNSAQIKTISTPPVVNSNDVTVNGLTFTLPNKNWTISAPKRMGNQQEVIVNTGTDQNNTLDVSDPLTNLIDYSNDPYPPMYKNDSVKIYGSPCGGGWCQSYGVQFNDNTQYSVMISHINDSAASALSEADASSIIQSVRR